MFSSGCILMSNCSVVCREPMVEQGRQAFFNEDYTLARQIFLQLALREDDVQLQAVGLYGNVCLDMILAEHAPAFRTAVEQLLHLPSQLSCPVPADGDPGSACRKVRNNRWAHVPAGMLEKAMVHGMVLLESERSGIVEKLNTLYARQEVYKKERLKMQEHIDSLDPKIKALEKQNMNQEARITDLLHQISVLEKIDKERQEQRENQ